MRIESIEAVDSDALAVEVKQLKQRDSDDRKIAKMQRKMWELAHGIKRRKKRGPRRGAPGATARDSDTDDEASHDADDEASVAPDDEAPDGDDDAAPADSDGEAGDPFGDIGGGGGDGPVGHDGGHGGGGDAVEISDSGTPEEHDLGIALVGDGPISDGPVDDGPIPDAAPAPIPLPHVVGDKVFDRPGAGGRHIGNMWRYYDDRGNESLIAHCIYPDRSRCKRRTTSNKHPDWNGALRWIVAGQGGLSQPQHAV